MISKTSDQSNPISSTETKEDKILTEIKKGKNFHRPEAETFQNRR